MGCDYYITSELVIEYIDTMGALSKTITNRILEKGYIMSVPEQDSDDDIETQQKKYDEELERTIDRRKYKKIMYENEKWVKSSYEKRYVKDLKFLCPNMVKIIKIYKDYNSWKNM